MRMDMGRCVALVSAVFAVVLLVAGCASSNDDGTRAVVSVASISSVMANSPMGSTTPNPISSSGPPTVAPSPQPVSSTAGQVTSSPTAVASTSEQRAQLASALVAHLTETFARLLPPGAQPIAQGPIPDTDLPEAGNPNINVVQSAHWYTVPQPQDAALAYVAARMPAGFIQRGGDMAAGVLAYVSNAYAGQETETYDTPIIDVLATSDNGQTKIWIDAVTTWRPVRTPAEFVATNVSGATAVSAPGGDYLGATMHLDSTQAQRVAQLLNALDTRRPNADPCNLSPVYTVTFDGISQTFDIGDCAEATVHTGSTQQPALADDAPDGQRSVLDSELDTIFGRQIGCGSADIILATSCPIAYFSSTG